METMKVKLESARCGHRFDKERRFVGVFAQPHGAIVDMPEDEALRYLDKGLATEVVDQKKLQPTK